MIFIPKTDSLSVQILTGFLLLFPYFLYGQQKVENNKYASQSILTSSPVASSVLVYGNTPVSQYTGTPDINVPIHQVSFKDLSVNISLQYHHANGSKPDVFPGPVGNGFSLNNGGVITRISRGVTQNNFPSGTPIPVDFNPTADADWSSNAKMQNHIKTQTIFTNNNGRYDEYAYNFGGTSGKFYIDQNDGFRIKTAQGEDILVEKEVLVSKSFTIPAETQTPSGCTTTPYSNIITQANFIYKFTLTDSKGVKYTFGGTDPSIEFTRPGMGYGVFDVNNQNTVATSWYLTSILSPNGYKIDLNYIRDKFYITNEISVSDRIIAPNSWADNDNFPKGKVIKSTLFHPCYLDEIITPASKVKFTWSTASSQLGYNFSVNCSSPTDLNSQIYFYAYPQVKDATLSGRFPNKLDKVEVSTTAGTLKKTVEFGYTNSTSTRLKLLTLTTKAGTESMPPYQFGYNTAVPLPAYLSFKTDDWGFYNNKGDLYMSSTDPIYYYNLFNSATERQLYLNSRKPDVNYTQAEILTKITYPTGGYTEYEYENNDYGREAKYWPASILENTGGIQYTGGLRIKRISDYDFANHKATEKKYYYKKDYATGGSSSSGVLSFQPLHYAFFSGTVTAPARYVGTSSQPNFTGTMTYRQYSTDPMNAVTYNKGSHISYSEVTELNLDGSYTVFKFKNFDNGYHDNPAENYVSDNSNVGEFWKEDEMNSLELERGQLLSEGAYNSTNTLVQNSVYNYNDDAGRFNNNVRRIKFIPNPIFSVNYPSLRYTATLIYVYYPYLKTKTVTNYDQGGSIAKATSYTYAANRLMSTQSFLNSKAQTVLVSNKYPHDYPSDPVNLAMANKHIIAPVIETTTSVSGVQVNLVHTNYYAPFTGIYVPQNIQVKNGTNPIETRQNFNQYDNQGNLLEQQKPGDVKETYLWGYQGQYIVAKVLGSDFSTVQSQISQPILDNAATATDANIRTELNKIRTALAGQAMVTTYTYNALVGNSSITDPAGKVIHYEYDIFSRLKSLHNNDASGNVRVSYCYNYAGQAVPCTALAPTGSIAASTLALISEEPPLPVTLTEFNAVKYEQSALLSWKTTMETNSDRFEIERSINGKQWLKLGSVPSQGENNGTQRYSFTDSLPVIGAQSHGENLYRIKMIDSDGTFAYSRIQSLIFGTDSKVSIYPNPITIGENINLLIDDISTVLNIKIYDSTGTLVHQSSPQRKIAANKISAGLYMIQITYMDGSISTHRVVKQ
ncbi:hypothetical protein SAMN04487995_3820 [Dyadobacter koreensis]|uniref:Secretion system C-terminal sorting domain-containing protein n=1 Tax=Dyadobacter koreensis TaxID=408657 RepID=A0A1H6XD66_9BACT|nr:T9SS type A sorting domain-containing protein [Dyadobacter koreensis]SEJ26056.1 hypothetical protein SAMN04487995_3820 [Dyadobacter koreensis]